MSPTWNSISKNFRIFQFLKIIILTISDKMYVIFQLQEDFNKIVQCQVETKQISQDHARTLSRAVVDKWPEIASKLLTHFQNKCSNRELKKFLESQAALIQQGVFHFHSFLLMFKNKKIYIYVYIL